MAIDRGGLRYNIEAKDQFSANFKKFRAEISAADADLRRLQATARKGVAVSTIQRQLKSAQQSSKALASDMEKVGRETGLTGRALREEVIARRKIAAEQSKIRVETKKARQEQKDSFDTAKKTLGTTRQEAKAQREITKTVDRRNVAIRKAAVARERSAELSSKELRAATAVSDLQKDQVRSAERLERAQRAATDKKISDLRVEEQITKRIAAARERQRVVSSLREQGFDSKGNALPPQVGRSVRAFRDLSQALDSADNRANRVSFTFRRLFGILAAFTLVRKLGQAFSFAVRSLVTLSAEVEQAELGIASLFTAVADIRNPFGETVSSAQALALAQKEARNQTELLRQDALRTTATFRTLLDTFQVAIAPGLASGLDIGEVREFTVQISQAAAAIGLQQNQLAEEIRSILQGTIQSRTTRIAVALGITNEDIRNAKEAGVLAEFLEEKFVAFNEAGKESFNTFNGLVSRVQDAFELLLNTGGIEFFNEVKDAARDLFDLLTDQDDLTGRITPDPRAVKLVQAISKGLASAVSSARQIASNLSFDSILISVFSFGRFLAAAAEITAGIIEGLVDGLTTTAGILKEAYEVVKDIFGIADDESPREIARTVTKILTTLFLLNQVVGLVGVSVSTIQLSVGLLVAPINAFVRVLSLAVPLLGASAASAASLAGSMLLAVAIFGIVVELSRRLFSYLLGTELKVTTLVKLLRNAATTIFAGILLAGETVIKGLFISFLLGIKGVAKGLDLLLIKPLIAASKVLSELGVISGGLGQELQRVSDQINRGIDDRIEKTREEAKLAAEALKLVIERQKAEQANILAGAGNDKSAADLLLDQFKGVGKRISDEINSSLLGATGNTKSQITSLADQFDRLDPSVRRAATTLSSMSEIAKKLEDDIESSADSLERTGQTLGLDGSASGIVSAAFDAQIRAREDGKKFDDEVLKAQRELANVSKQRAINAGNILNLQADEQTTVRVTVGLFRELQTIENNLAQLENDRAISAQALAKATEQGLAGAAERARKSIADIDQQISAANDSTAEIREELEGITTLTTLFAGDLTAIGNLARQQVELTAEETVLQETLNSLISERARLEGQINQIKNNRIAAEALSSGQDREQSLIQQKFDLEKARLDLYFNNGFFSAEEKSLAYQTIELANLQAIFQQSKKISDSNIKALEAQREKTELDLRSAQVAEGLAQSDAQRAEFAAQALSASKSLAAQEQNLIGARLEAGLLQEEATTKLLEQEAILERARRRAEEPISQGLIEGVQAYFVSASNVFEEIREITTSAFSGLAQTGSQVIADIFDPTRNANLGQAIGRYLLNLGQQVVQVLLTQILAGIIAKFVSLFAAEKLFEATKIATNAAATAQWAIVGVQWQAVASTLLLAALILSASGGGFGLAKGGPVPVGRAEGGSMPSSPSSRVPKAPAGLHHTDRIPIWAAQNEFMVRASSAMKYGHDVLDRINRGLVDPMALRALVGTGTVRKQVSSMARKGLASGGAVVRSTVESTSLGSDSSSPAGAPIPAYIVADEQAAERLLAGGETAFVRFMDEQGFVRR